MLGADDQQTVLITGGNSGIGRAIAFAFVQRQARVILIGRNEETLRATAASLGSQASWYQADVSNGKQVREVLSNREKSQATIDVLVNAAGSTARVTTDTPFEQAEQTWDAIVDTNLKGCFLMSQAAAPYLPRPGGRIINISSVAAFTGGSSVGALAYAAAKAGVLGLTYALARELGPQGITVNAVAPGFIPGTHFFSGATLEERIRTTAGQTPMRRVGQPEDVAAAVLYLASKDASFMTGEVLNVDGGWLFGH